MCSSAASTTAPIRLPTQQAIQTRSMSAQLLSPRSTAKGMYMAVPVNSSDPAKTTMVRAEAKTAPITRCAQDGSAWAPTVNMKMSPKPI